LAQGAQTVTGTIAGVVATTFFQVTAAPATVTGALTSIAGLYTIVWTFDASTQGWMFYDTAATEVSDLDSLTRGQGYYVSVTEDCTIVFGGNTYSMLAGWNLIGWLG
jgi:hypothetical protein